MCTSTSQVQHGTNPFHGDSGLQFGGGVDIHPSHRLLRQAEHPSLHWRELSLYSQPCERFLRKPAAAPPARGGAIVGLPGGNGPVVKKERQADKVQREERERKGRFGAPSETSDKHESEEQHDMQALTQSHVEQRANQSRMEEVVRSPRAVAEERAAARAVGGVGHGAVPGGGVERNRAPRAHGAPHEVRHPRLLHRVVGVNMPHTCPAITGDN